MNVGRCEPTRGLHSPRRRAHTAGDCRRCRRLCWRGRRPAVHPRAQARRARRRAAHRRPWATQLILVLGQRGKQPRDTSVTPVTGISSSSTHIRFVSSLLFQMALHRHRKRYIATFTPPTTTEENGNGDGNGKKASSTAGTCRTRLLSSLTMRPSPV